MKRGFTLIELIVVIIIVGILAALGINQYSKMVEKARGAEARMIFGVIRSLAMAYRLENGSIDGMTSSDVNVGVSSDQVPLCSGGCRSAYYFCYDVYATDPVFGISATRCASGGKTPQYGSDLSSNPYFHLDSDLVTGQNTWYSGRGGAY